MTTKTMTTATTKNPTQRAKTSTAAAKRGPRAKAADGASEPKPANVSRAKTVPASCEIKTDTRVHMVRRIIVEHPDITIPECERLAQRETPEIDRNTMRGLYQGAMGFLKVAKSLGYKLAR